MLSGDTDLDLLSISQTKLPRCIFGAPLVALLSSGFGYIRQTCCNHWDCPRCGIVRAGQEYRRIVGGAEKIAVDHPLYFWTLTCRGKDCSLAEAEENYLVWTNRLLTNARTLSKRAGHFWAYAQITERQHKTRRHPHSHILTTFLPDDAQVSSDQDGFKGYVSAWFTRANFTAGLGTQHRISLVNNAAAVSRYVAKYMFKDNMIEEWPSHWRRVRYSQNWPELTRYTPDQAIILTTPGAWAQAGKMPVLWACETVYEYEQATHRITNICRDDLSLDGYLKRSSAFRDNIYMYPYS